jgi:CheY-like chemotaxis protein
MEKDTILIVDDNPANLKLIHVLLSGEGFGVRTAANADEAQKVLRECHPQLILMDIQLPGMDGLELTRRLKTDLQTRHIPIIGLTAYAMKGDEDRIRAAGCDGYIAKPVDTRKLPRLVRGFLKPEPARAKTAATLVSNRGQRSRWDV